MLAGHFATALVAQQHASARRYPASLLAWYLVVSQLPDLLWFAFHYLGLEPTEPRDLFDTTLQGLSVEMVFSHHLVSIVVWMVLVGVLGGALFRNRRVGLATAGLVALHALMDYLSGHPHYVFGSDTPQVGIGLYDTAPFIAIALEAVFTVGFVVWFFREEGRRGVVRSAGSRRAIVGLFVFGIAFMLSVATTSMRELLGLPSFDLPFGTTVPSLVVVYVLMGGILWAAVRRGDVPDTRPVAKAAETTVLADAGTSKRGAV